MPVVFRVPGVLELNKYGVFTTVAIPGGSISKTQSVSISDILARTGLTKGYGITPHATIRLDIKNFEPKVKEGWGAVIERFNWGASSRPNKLYYEIWNYGMLTPEMMQEGYHCGSFITEANVDNTCTHPAASNRLDVKLWNCSDPAQDVYYEFAGWFYKFDMQYLDSVVEKSFASLFTQLSDDIDAAIKIMTLQSAGLLSHAELLDLLGHPDKLSEVLARK